MKDIFAALLGMNPMNAIKELGLEMGKPAYAMVKVTSAMVAIDD